MTEEFRTPRGAVVDVASLQPHAVFPGVRVALDAQETGHPTTMIGFGTTPAFDPNGRRPEPHVHDEIDEVIICLTGEGYAIMGETKAEARWVPIKAPCVVYAAAGYWHLVVCTSAEPMEKVFVYAKAGTELPPFVRVLGELTHR